MKEITLTQNQVALIDDEDFDLISQHKWYTQKTRFSNYAMATIEKKHVMMHIFLLGKKEGKVIDHINGNGLDNRRKNLRFCSIAENVRNAHRTCGKSKYKGVSWHKYGKKWRAEIRYDYKATYLGYFDTEEQAALAYNSKALELFGEFACLNIIK